MIGRLDSLPEEAQAREGSRMDERYLTTPHAMRPPPPPSGFG